MSVTPRISVRAIILHEGKLLCVRQRPMGDPNAENEHWNLPGGGLEPGEALIDCLKREMIEETGIAAEPGNLMYVQQFAHDGQEYLDFMFHVTNGADYLNVDLSKTADGEAELAEIAFIDPATSNVLPRFLGTESLPEKVNAPTTVISWPTT